MKQPAAPNIHPMSALDPRFDFEAAQRFIELMRGNADCVMQFRALSPSHPKQNAGSKTLTPEELANKRRNYPGTLSSLAAKLQHKNMSGHGIFVALNEFDGNGRKKENLVAAHVLVLDLDGSPLPGTWEVPPHWIQETSPGRYQCFFVIERNTDIAAVEDASRRLAAHYGGDPAVCDATHVFRVPGFYHQKANGFRCALSWKTNSTRRTSFRTLTSCQNFRSVKPLELAGIGVLSAELAEEILEQLDVSDFSSNLPWRDLANGPSCLLRR